MVAKFVTCALAISVSIFISGCKGGNGGNGWNGWYGGNGAQGNRRLRNSSDKNDLKKVLVVVDMENDYDKFGATPETVSQWATNLTDTKAKIVKVYNEYLNGKQWDAVVFTQDWLDPAHVVAESEQREKCLNCHEAYYSKDTNRTNYDAVCTKEVLADCKWSLEMGKKGTNIVPELVGAITEGNGAGGLPECSLSERNTKPCYTHITKNWDDWSNKVPGHIALNGEKVGDEMGTFKNIASFITGKDVGDVSDIQLVVVGIETVRCVMKGALHAFVGDGFRQVTVVADATTGGSETKNDVSWDEQHIPMYCPDPEGDGCTPDEMNAWGEQVWTARGGPSIPNALQILENGGVTVDRDTIV